MHQLRTIGALVLILVLCCTGCTYNPATGRQQFLSMSTSQEIAVGEEATPKLTQEYGGEVTAIRPYVNEVGKRLAQHVEPQYKDLPWEFIVLDTEQINAFALPGGKVFICRGLVSELADESQLAGVLGHEIGHVTGQHIDERISHQWGADVVLEVFKHTTESQAAVQIASLFNTGYQLRFSRQQESESDALGLKYMVAAGYDPRGLVGVLEVLRDASEGSRPIELFSTHPNPETRLEQIAELLNSEYKYAVDNPSYQRYKQQFTQRALQPLGQ